MESLAILLAIPLAGGLALWALGERDSAPEANAAFSFATFVASAWLTSEVISGGPILALEEQFSVDATVDRYLELYRYRLGQSWRPNISTS